MKKESSSSDSTDTSDPNESHELSDNCEYLFFSDTGTNHRENPLHSTRCEEPSVTPRKLSDGCPSVSRIDPEELRPRQNAQVGPYDYAPVIRERWPTPAPEAWKMANQHMSIYMKVKDTNLPNYILAKIPIPSDIKCDAWADLLSEYHDAEIVDYLCYGWPGGYVAQNPPKPTTVNHPSATGFNETEHVAKFINTELQKGAMLGPFKASPFDKWNQTSPLMTCPKKQSANRRVIIDLSFPVGHSVNDGVPKNVFQGEDVNYSLPTLQDLVEIVKKNSRDSYLWKADLERAY